MQQNNFNNQGGSFRGGRGGNFQNRNGAGGMGGQMGGFQNRNFSSPVGSMGVGGYGAPSPMGGFGASPMGGMNQFGNFGRGGNMMGGMRGGMPQNRGGRGGMGGMMGGMAMGGMGMGMPGMPMGGMGANMGMMGGMGMAFSRFLPLFQKKTVYFLVDIEDFDSSLLTILCRSRRFRRQCTTSLQPGILQPSTTRRGRRRQLESAWCEEATARVNMLFLYPDQNICIILRNSLPRIEITSSGRKILTALIWRSAEIQVRCGREMVFYSHQLLIPRGAMGVLGELDLGTFTFFNTKIYYFLLLFVVLYFMETRSAVTRILRCDMYGWRF